MTAIAPEVITTKEAHDLVGGRKVWEELMALYRRKILKPFRTLPRGDTSYLREVVLAALRAAQLEGALNDRPRVERALKEYHAELAAQTAAKEPK